MPTRPREQKVKKKKMKVKQDQKKLSQGTRLKNYNIQLRFFINLIKYQFAPLSEFSSLNKKSRKDASKRQCMEQLTN